MKKILYLLGAGASAKCVPTVAGISSEMTALDRMIYNSILQDDGSREILYFSDLLAKEFVEDCIWLGENGLSHGTIDIFAKKLYLKNEIKQLRRLKQTLSFYLLFKQMHMAHDVRYDVFLTTIMKLNNGKIMIPDEIIIGTWNYDNQILIALLNILGFFEPNYALQLLEIHPWHSNNDHSEIQRPKLFHSNGMAGFATSALAGSVDFYHLIGKGFTDDSAKEFNKIYKEITPGTNFSIHFAWENESTVENVRNSFFKTIAQVETIIVIGYSFPTFNRDYDKKILKEAPLLKKIYVQDISPDGVIERIKSLTENNVEIIPIRNPDQFYIPAEIDI
ncbi:hypothetical protein [Leptospira stimsonii]|uniref:SIR2-like domain-containing protein n=1 Tax=Leptospira stimsonii TaxID=2202203 RepID=A0ABY2N552_9LEPT|nr:hypothetical protein [Leptospira stimsonii]TGK23595.1 hypothetical protein EHO98_04915 [Leptospira stimsonii]TGM17233.1 hypothetical protein EHQ90_07835 [Leptospira stimsonii]